MSKLKAFDKNINLSVQRLDANEWDILEVDKLHKTTYLADDILSTENTKKINFYRADVRYSWFKFLKKEITFY